MSDSSEPTSRFCNILLVIVFLSSNLSEKEAIDLINFVSAANKHEDEKVATFGMSFVYMTQSRGPKILACGTHSVLEISQMKSHQY